VAHSKQLVGYGAPRKAWAAHHRADRDPRLSAGCCFLPRQGDGQDRYYGVAYSHGRVVFYQMHFAPRVSATAARRLMRAEFPSDSHVTVQRPTQRYEQIDYCSTTLKVATGYGNVEVWLLFGGETPRRGVQDVIVQAASTNGDC
jgi:hypothetical protein